MIHTISLFHIFQSAQFMKVYKWPIYINLVYLRHMFQSPMGHHQVLFRVKCCIYNQYG
jgi:hypothetical protein